VHRFEEKNIQGLPMTNFNRVESGAPAPFAARHIERSLVCSADDDPARPSDRLLDLALQAAQRARSVSLASIVQRMHRPPYYPDVWPGEHYKLLAGLVEVLRPSLIVEVGTATGLSALTMHQSLPAGGRMVTFDVVPWQRFPDTVLRNQDFADGTLRQHLGDLSERAVMQQHAALVQSAELIFIDGPKDGRFEQVLLERLTELPLKQRPVLVFDDIRLWTMLAIWRDIRQPKLDVTSFGHWSGTGLVDWLAAAAVSG
jgi:predicted O-methyltransferase YrrM